MRKMKTLSVNQEFVCNGRRWVVIPHMGLECNGHSFLVNAITVVESDDPYYAPQAIAEYFHPETMVQVVEK